MSDEPLGHAAAEDQGLVALYHRGQLEPELEARFEAHFFACPLCQEELEHQRRLERAIKALATEQTVSLEHTGATHTGAEPKATVLAFPSSRPRLWLALAAGLVLASGLPFLWLWSSRGELSRQAEELGRQLESERQARTALESKLAEGQSGWELERRELETRLAEEQTRRSAGLKPLAGTPVLLLARMRSTAASTLNVLELEKAPALVQLAVDVGADPRFVSYRVELEDGAGKVVFAAERLQPNTLEVILLTFPREFFAVGTYRLIAAGRLGEGGHETLDTYRFHVTR